MAGSPCPLPLMRQVIETLGAREITIGYGQTEASPIITQTWVDDPIEVRVGTVGREIPGVEARTLVGCGHVPMWDDTAQVVSTICQFIDRQSASESPAAGTGTNGYSQEPSPAAPALPA